MSKTEDIIKHHDTVPYIMNYNVCTWIQTKIFQPGLRYSLQNAELQSVHRAKERIYVYNTKKKVFVPSERSTEQ